MLYKRQEYFRHSFGTPLDATFRILAGEGTSESNPGSCQLLDISPGGAKIETDFNIPTVKGQLSIAAQVYAFQNAD